MRTFLLGVFSVALSLSLASPVIQAQEGTTGQPGQSVLYQGQPSDYRHLTTLPDGAKGSGPGSDHCAELRRWVDELKGRPQRRSTAMARYEAECQREGNLR